MTDLSKEKEMLSSVDNAKDFIDLDIFNKFPSMVKYLVKGFSSKEKVDAIGGAIRKMQYVESDVWDFFSCSERFYIGSKTGYPNEYGQSDEMNGRYAYTFPFRTENSEIFVREGVLLTEVPLRSYSKSRFMPEDESIQLKEYTKTDIFADKSVFAKTVGKQLKALITKSFFTGVSCVTDNKNVVKKFPESSSNYRIKDEDELFPYLDVYLGAPNNFRYGTYTNLLGQEDAKILWAKVALLIYDFKNKYDGEDIVVILPPFAAGSFETLISSSNAPLLYRGLTSNKVKIFSSEYLPKFLCGEDPVITNDIVIGTTIVMFPVSSYDSILSSFTYEVNDKARVKNYNARILNSDFKFATGFTNLNVHFVDICDTYTSELRTGETFLCDPERLDFFSSHAAYARTPYLNFQREYIQME